MLEFRTRASVKIKPVLYNGLDGCSAHVVWSNKSFPNGEDLLIAQGDIPPLGSVCALISELLEQGRVLVHSSRA